ncbi:MAG TPA: hypothetical protein VHF05_03295 [Candidatus Paceibacterota bacterium]|nr:hypothetical protein [Candidatus Paceibacterota bacterium]
MQAFLVFNSVAIPIAFGSSQQETVKILISVIGFFVHVGLSITVWQAIRWIRYLDDALADFEQLDTEVNSVAAVRVAIFSNVIFEQRRGGWLRSHAYLVPFGIGAISWFLRIAAHFYF